MTQLFYSLRKCPFELLSHVLNILLLQTTCRSSLYCSLYCRLHHTCSNVYHSNSGDFITWLVHCLYVCVNILWSGVMCRLYGITSCVIHYRMGAGDIDHRQFAQQVDLYTGSLNLTPHICSHHSNYLGYEQVYIAYLVALYIMVSQFLYQFLHFGLSYFMAKYCTLLLYANL